MCGSESLQACYTNSRIETDTHTYRDTQPHHMLLLAGTRGLYVADGVLMRLKH